MAVSHAAIEQTSMIRDFSECSAAPTRTMYAAPHRRLRNSLGMATRYDKRAYVFHGTVTAAAIRLWLRQ
ncbi:hypothetical protein OTC26_024040 [Streptomyces tirandamycinicus]|uniref:hypothetical protein n=1 Tax=Streptomyces tirandamycinicus TaxID=2174846 RepID=UPI0039843B7D